MFFNGIKFTLIVITLSVISGCTTTPSHPGDPFEPLNRKMFLFNDNLDKAILKPVAKTYKTITPEPVDKGITNFFSNLGDVIVIANDLLQFKFQQAASDTGRLLVNTTVGLLGFVDIATDIGLPKHNEDFGQTLGYWGLNDGPYLVLPFLGPSSLRDTIGLSADIFLDPISYYTRTSGNTSANRAVRATKGVEIVDKRADLIELEGVLEEAALDKYTYYREAYLQRRNYLVNDGNMPTNTEDVEALFSDDASMEFIDDDLFSQELEE